jgi:hypothetical protein
VRPRFAFLFLLLAATAAADVFDAVAVNHFGSGPFTFRIAFFRDPDLAAQPFGPRRDTLVEKISLFVRRLTDTLGSDLEKAGFGDLSISLIEDYDRLWEERRRGAFDLLHCDPAVFLIGEGYLEGGDFDDPYEVFLEESTGAEEPGPAAVIWVRGDSPLRDVRDLAGRHVVAVHRSCLLGGALQRAFLALNPSTHFPEPVEKSGGAYPLTECGSVSDAVLRLITGLANQAPVEAAFLPEQAPGLLLAAREMGLPSSAALPLRVLARIPTEPLPSNLLLLHRSLSEEKPEQRAGLIERIKAVLLAERTPFRWDEPGIECLGLLRERLGPLSRAREPQP